MLRVCKIIWSCDCVVGGFECIPWILKRDLYNIMNTRVRNTKKNGVLF